MYRNTYVRVNLNNINCNVKNIINYYSGYKYYIGVVKANAYGYGFDVVKTMKEAGINYFAVSNLDEALSVRKLVDTPILCLEPIPLKYIDKAIESNITITLSNYHDFLKLKEMNIDDLKIHLKIDSGMNRLGFTEKNIIKEVYDNLKNNIEGIYTHMATSGINDKKFDNQIDKFIELTSLIDLSKVKIVHIGRSATIINHKKFDFVNATRIGILMYGVKQNDITFTGLKGRLRKIKRDMRLKKYNISKTILNCPIQIKESFKLISEVIEIKDVKKGSYIGYGLKNKIEENIKIAIIPVGYADGFDIRNTGNYVFINNKKCKIVGTVNSGMISVLIDDSVKINDEVIVINSVKDISSYTKQTVYTVTSNIDSSLNRIYMKGE